MIQIVGLNLTKMSVERIENVKGKFKVTSKIDVKNVYEEKVSPIEGKSFSKLEFEYNIDYDPKLAEIKFKGELLLLSDQKEMKDFVADWKKKGNIMSELKVRMYNAIFHKCNLKALEIEDDFGLPPHIQLPHISSQEEKKTSYTG